MIALPIPAAALEQHTAIVGKTGSGKTSTAKLAVEQVVADGSRVCVLDPIKSDWWGVISSADGKRPGLPFHVLGGPHAHVPLHAGAGAAIGELVARGDLPLSVLDMAEFEPGGQLRFFVDFAPKLLQRMRGVLYLVLEEAHLFAPKERSGMGHEQMAIHWAKTLATAGRSKGIRLIVATQRTQALHNAVLGSCDTLIAHRLTAPADRTPVEKWLLANVEKEVAQRVAGELGSLKTGTAWVCAGEAQVFERIEFPRISTFDNSATPTADSEDVQVRGNDVDMGALRTLIGEAVAEAEANDPELLKKRIQELERRLRERAPGGVDETEVEDRIFTAEQRVREEMEAAAQARVREAIGALRTEVRPHVEALGHVLLNGWQPPDPAARPAPAPRAAPPSPPPAPRARAAAPVPRSAAVATGKLPEGERLILTAIAQHPEGVTREQIGILTGYKRSTRDAYIQRLAGKELVYVEGTALRAYSAGLDALGDDFQPLPTGDALRQYWLARLPEGERAVLEAVASVYPATIGRDDVSELTGYKRSTRDAYLQRLGTRRLITSVGRGEVRAADELFTRRARR